MTSKDDDVPLERDARNWLGKMPSFYYLVGVGTLTYVCILILAS